MTVTSSGIPRAIAELETEQANLAARLEKVSEAIALLRTLFHLRAGAAAPRPAPNGNGNGHHAAPDETDRAIRAALKNGPLSPGALAAAVSLERAALRYRVRQLERDGIIVSTGTTAARRIALAGSPAKEAP